jgi:hypothetical protein
MHIEAFPARFVAVTDGVIRGEEHVVLFFEAGAGPSRSGSPWSCPTRAGCTPCSA